MRFLSEENYIIENNYILGATLIAVMLGFWSFFSLIIKHLFDYLLDNPLPRIKTFCGVQLKPAVIFFILLIAWLPYIVYFFPGCIASDTSRQMAIYFETTELARNNFFPWFVSMLYGSIYQIGSAIDSSGMQGVFFLVCFQAIIAAYAFTLVITWIKKIGLHVLSFITLIFFALFPLIPTYIVIIGKDSLHAFTLVVFALQLLLLAVSRNKKLPRTNLISPWAICVSATLVALTRNNGIFLVIPALLIFCVLYKDRIAGIVCASTLTLFIVWVGVALPAMNVAPGPASEALSMPVQIVAANISKDKTTLEENYAIAQKYFWYGPEEIAENYNPLRSDYAKRDMKIHNTADIIEFTSLAMQLTLENPALSLSAALITAHEAWYPFTKGKGSLYGEHVPYTSFEDGWTRLASWYPSFATEEKRIERAKVGCHAIQAFRSIPPFSILYTPGYYAWLIALLMGFSLYAQQYRKAALCILAPFFMLELVLVAAPVASLRYALPLCMCLPIFISFFVLIIKEYYIVSKNVTSNK